jgi:hypothetical protein
MLKTQGIDRNARVAILVSPNDYSHFFIETVLNNAGLYAKIFTDPDLARLHLIKQKHTDIRSCCDFSY